MTDKLSHIRADGTAHMVDVTEKDVTARRAYASGIIILKPATLDRIRSGDLPKGDTLAVARVAAIMAVKRTHDLIPMCHPLPVEKITVDFLFEDNGLSVFVDVKCDGKTGVEMEALTGVSVALLTVYDMVKAVDKGAVIEGIRLLEKSGGKSGHYIADGLS